MRARIRNRVMDEVGRKIRIVRLTVECELQHSRAWHLKLIAKLCHIWSDGAKVLGDKRQAPQFSLGRLEKAGSWSRHPLARPRCFSASRHVPRGCETTEVIQANCVYVAQQRANPIDAPLVTRGTKCIPVVDGITP